MAGERSSFHIGRVAAQTGLSVDAIRFYERSGLLREPVRSEGGYRLFSDSDVRNLKFVRRAQELGFSLAEIKELILVRDRHEHTCAHVRDLLRSKVERVGQKIAQLEVMKRELEKALRTCNRDLRRTRSTHEDCCPVLEKLGKEESKKKYEQ